MSNNERYATVIKSLAAVLAVLGLWIIIAPVVLPGAEFALTHIIVGGVIVAVATGYTIQLHRNPETKISSIWFVLVLGVLLLTGTLLAHTPNTVFFWSTIITSTLMILLALVSIFWGSRFVTGEEQETTIFRR